MNDSVALLRARWTPELTDAAIRFLQGNPGETEIPTMQLDGQMQLDLRGIRIEGTQLDGMVIRKANLRWATIHDVGFKGARLIDCNLSQAFFSECYFRRTVFQGCDIVNAKFESCDFPNARLEASRLDYARLRNCEIGLASIAFREDGNAQVLARVCHNLKLNAMSMGHLGDVSELSYMEKTFERHALFNQAFGTGGAKRGGFEAIVKWLDSLALNWIWGYGERPWRLFLAGLVAVFGFGTLQYSLNGIPNAGWWEHIYFSGITFLTIGYGDLVPVDAVPRMLSVLEGIFGITVIGLLIASATKKIMNR
jgi:Ion channel/Pentapeptide repeats (9 copies)